MITDVDIEKLKGTFATKDDIKVFATKDDLKAFATKDDLKAFATKDDLKAFATKEDLADLAVEVGEIKEELGEVKDVVKRIEVTLDGIAGAIGDLRTENSMGAAHLERHDRQIAALASHAGITLPD